MRKAGRQVKGRFCSYDDRRDCLPEPVGKSFPEHLYNSQNHSATWTKGRGPRFPGFMEEHVEKSHWRYCEHVSPWLQPGAVCFLDMLEGCEIVFRLQFSKEKKMIFEYPFNTHLLCTDG